MWCGGALLCSAACLRLVAHVHAHLFCCCMRVVMLLALLSGNCSSDVWLELVLYVQVRKWVYTPCLASSHISSRSGCTLDVCTYTQTNMRQRVFVSSRYLSPDSEAKEKGRLLNADFHKSCRHPSSHSHPYYVPHTNQKDTPSLLHLHPTSN